MARTIVFAAALAFMAMASASVSAAEGPACPSVPTTTYKFTCPGTSGPTSLVEPANPRPHRPHRHVYARPAPRLPAYAPQAQVASVAPQATGGCPAIDTLKVNIWGHEAIALPGVERTDAREQMANRFDVYPRIAHVSYDHGAQFRQAYADGQIRRASRPHMLQLSFIMTSQARGGAPDILREQVVGVIADSGLYEWRIPRAVRQQWDAERIVPINNDVSSPPASGQTGYHELRFFNHLPENPAEGEWARNPVPDCLMNVHFVE